MDLGTHMMGNEADDPFGVGRRDLEPVSSRPPEQPVDPEPSIRVEHDLDDARVFEVSGDQGAERRAQHARASGDGFGSKSRSSSRRTPQCRLKIEAMGAA